MNDDIIWSSLTEQIELMRVGKISAHELAGLYLKRIESFDGELKSYVYLNSDVLQQAEQIDRRTRSGQKCGPLAGACIAIKDNYLTADMPTRVGTDVDALSFPRTDSRVVSKLRQAGALILGKTRLHEFAWGAVTPPARNPWNTEYVPGGSSGGSGAAVAAGLCGAATGSDTGGSIRMPASLCGVVGIKPTFGLVSRAGVVPHSWSLDHAGPLTKTVGDAALLLQTFSGYDLGDPSSVARHDEYVSACGESIKGIKVALITNHFSEEIADDVERSFNEALQWARSEGLEIREYKIPSLEYGLAAIFAIELSSASAYHDRAIQQGLTTGYKDDVRDLIDMGRLVTGVDYLHAEQIRTVMCREMAAILKDNDVILTPTMPISAWRSGQSSVEIKGELHDVLESSWRFTYPFNLTGLPAISIPMGLGDDGLPVGLQIVGKPFAERDVLKLASAFEKAHKPNVRRPPRFG